MMFMTNWDYGFLLRELDFGDAIFPLEGFRCGNYRAVFIAAMDRHVLWVDMTEVIDFLNYQHTSLGVKLWYLR